MERICRRRVLLAPAVPRSAPSCTLHLHFAFQHVLFTPLRIYERRFKCALHAYLEMGNYCCSCKSQKPAKGEWVQYMHKGSYKPEWARVYSLVPNTFGELTVEFDKHPQLKNRTGFHQLQRHYRQDCQSTPPGGFGRRYRGGCASQGARFRPCQPCDVWRDVLLQAALRQVSRPVMF